jgi:hypothetical protein
MISSLSLTWIKEILARIAAAKLRHTLVGVRTPPVPQADVIWWMLVRTLSRPRKKMSS